MSDKATRQNADMLFKTAFDENYVSVYHYCLSRLKNNEMAEDCVQEAFLVFYNKLLSGEEIIYAKAFLMKTASNFILKKFEEMKKTKNTVSIDEVIDIPSQNEDVDDRLTFEEYSRQISAALSDKEEELFSLRYIEGMKIEEVAARMNMSITATTTRLSRIRQKLQKMFEKELK